MATSSCATTSPRTAIATPPYDQTTKGGPISTCTTMICSSPLLLQISAIHQESISFLVTVTMNHSIILGFHWMHLDKEITKWSKHCLHSCLHLRCLTVTSTSVESPNTPIMTPILEVYHYLSEVFSKIKASSLPPHRLYDCTIDLVPGTTPPRNRIHCSSVSSEP